MEFETNLAVTSQHCQSEGASETASYTILGLAAREEIVVCSTYLAIFENSWVITRRLQSSATILLQESVVKSIYTCRIHEKKTGNDGLDDKNICCS